jgi:hypothetical protein
MKNIIGRLPQGLRERPFDVYTAFILFMVGIYGIADDNFPERFSDELTIVFINIISAYLMAASSVILVALFKDKRQYPVFNLFGQLFGWAFISAAALATSLIYAMSILFHGSPESWTLWSIWLIIWFTMFVASMLRTMELYNIYRGCKK